MSEDRKVHDVSIVSKEGGTDEKAEESQTIQQRVEGFFNNVFGRWGEFISYNPCKVFWLSMLVFILLAGGMAKSQGFEDESIVWTPSGNPSLQAREKGGKLFPSKGGFIGLLAEVKNPSDASSTIITTQAIKDIKDFQAKLQAVKLTITLKSGEKKDITWSSVCVKAGPNCLYGESLLTFELNSNGAVQAGLTNA